MRRPFSPKKRLIHVTNALYRAKPINYNISLYDLKFEGDFGYNGSVRIDLKVSKPIKEITLNANQLTIEKAVIESKGQEGEPSRRCRQV